MPGIHKRHSYFKKFSNAQLWVSAALLSIFWFRLFFGADTTDESWYSALGYRIALGQIPYKDDLSTVQGPGIFLALFYRLWNFIASPEGIVLFTRRLYFFLYLFATYWMSKNLRRSQESAPFFLISLSSLFFCPFTIPSVSFNTLSVFFLILGLFWPFYFELSKESRPIAWVTPGLFLSASVLCYFPFMALIPVMVVLYWFYLGLRNFYSFFFFLVGIAAVPLGLMWGYHLETENIVRSFQWATQAHVDYLKDRGVSVSLDKRVWTLFVSWFDVAILNRSMLTLLGSMAISQPVWKYGTLRGILEKALLATSFTFLFYDNLFIRSNFTTHRFLLQLNMHALVIYISYFRTAKNLRPLFFLVWAPSLVLGVITSLVSSNGLQNAQLGLLVSTPLAILMGYLLIRIQFSKTFGNVPQSLYVVGCLLFFIIGQRNPFGDLGITQLKHKIGSGPFKGIYSHQEKKVWLELLNTDLNALPPDDCRLASLRHFPSLFIHVPRLPAVRSLFFEPSAKQILTDRIQADHCTYVFQPSFIYLYNGQKWMNPVFNSKLEAEYVPQCRLFKSRNEYKIFYCPKIEQPNPTLQGV